MNFFVFPLFNLEVIWCWVFSNIVSSTSELLSTICHRELVECSSFDDVFIQIVICIFYCKYRKDSRFQSFLLVCFLFVIMVKLVFPRTIVLVQTEEQCLTRFILLSVYSCVLCYCIIRNVDNLFMDNLRNKMKHWRWRGVPWELIYQVIWEMMVESCLG